MQSNWLNKLERKVGKFSIPNLMNLILVGMAVVFLSDILSSKISPPKRMISGFCLLMALTNTSWSFPYLQECKSVARAIRTGAVIFFDVTVYFTVLSRTSNAQRRNAMIRTDKSEILHLLRDFLTAFCSSLQECGGADCYLIFTISVLLIDYCNCIILRLQSLRHRFFLQKTNAFVT